MLCHRSHSYWNGQRKPLKWQYLFWHRSEKSTNASVWKETMAIESPLSGWALWFISAHWHTELTKLKWIWFLKRITINPLSSLFWVGRYIAYVRCQTHVHKFVSKDCLFKVAYSKYTVSTTIQTNKCCFKESSNNRQYMCQW